MKIETGVEVENRVASGFYNTPSTKLALQALYMLQQIRPSVHPSVLHTPVLCQNEGTQRDAVFTIG